MGLFLRSIRIERMNTGAVEESYSACNPSMTHDALNAKRLIHLSIERNLERNRKHAKRTRLRKKEVMEVMKGRILELQREVIMLRQNACNTLRS